MADRRAIVDVARGIGSSVINVNHGGRREGRPTENRNRIDEWEPADVEKKTPEDFRREAAEKRAIKEAEERVRHSELIARMKGGSGESKG